jgi:hypothetical protein
LAGQIRVGLWALYLLWTAVRAGGAELEAGPLVHEFSLTLRPGHRLEAAGPFFFSQQSGGERSIGVPPLFSLVEDAEVDSREFDVLYPLLTYDRYGPEFRWQLLQLLSFAGGERLKDEAAERRVTIFPVYFQQRSTNAVDNYTAVFPLYGTLKNRLFRDEIRFVLFPLYGQTQRRLSPSRVEVTTDNYLYPFFHLRRGDGLRGWQFWPLAGHETKAVTTRINDFGELELVAGHETGFVLWPFYLHSHQGIGTDNPGRTVASLPWFSLERSRLRDTTIVLWPFFIHTDDRARRYREWDLPWPLIVFARPTGPPVDSPAVLRRWPASQFAGGSGKTVTRVFPLFGQAYTERLLSEFYLWPLYKRNRAHVPPLDRDRWRLLLYLYSDLTEKNLDTGAALRRRDLWPVFTWRADREGCERLQVLAPLEPILPNNKSIERNWSPLWSLWRAEADLQTGARSQSLLWNVYRREETPEARKCSLLFGLFRYQSSAEGTRWRLFPLPAVQSPPAPAAAAGAN